VAKEGYSNANVYLPIEVKKYYDKKAEKKDKSLSAYLRAVLTQLKKSQDLTSQMEEV